MKIYLASNFGSQSRLRLTRDVLESQGHAVVSTWLDEEGSQSYELHPDRGPGYSLRDLGEVNQCELLIIDTMEESCTGGREVEYGIALANGIRLWRVGPARNIFHTIAGRAFSSWNEAYGALRFNGTGGSDSGVCEDAVVGDERWWEEEGEGGEA